MNAKFVYKLSQMSPADLYAAVYCDFLTGALNRKAFDENESEFKNVAVIDLDSLKYLNDTSGHRTGDAFLCSLARAMTRVFGTDTVYRLSGDEFAVLGDDHRDIRRKLEQARLVFPGFSYGIGSGVVEADKQLRADKAFRERVGFRASRGECPPWMDRAEAMAAVN